MQATASRQDAAWTAADDAGGRAPPRSRFLILLRRLFGPASVRYKVAANPAAGAVSSSSCSHTPVTAFSDANEHEESDTEGSGSGSNTASTDGKKARRRHRKEEDVGYALISRVSFTKSPHLRKVKSSIDTGKRGAPKQHKQPQSMEVIDFEDGGNIGTALISKEMSKTAPHLRNVHSTIDTGRKMKKKALNSRPSGTGSGPGRKE